MMHHPNMHHQPMSRHPPQHMAGHQGMAGHHQMPPPHQMHRDNRHVPMTRVPMGPSQTGNGMGAHGQPMGGMGAMVPPHHGQRPHAIRPMHHPQQHHNVPQPMKPMRRPYGMNGGYPPVYPPPPMQAIPPPERPVAPPAAAPTSPPPAAEPPPEEPRSLANSKEKTPMCLVNELARFNKIKHQYRLTSETGPAHKKVFTVTLRLGETEEYTAEGSSIKRAQHAAAQSALSGTRYPAPPPRLAPPSHHHHHRHQGTVMPTVELNALAMKLCQPAVYTMVPGGPAPRVRPPAPRHPPPFLPYRPPPTLLYRVRVSVGGRAWLGSGATPQAARHDAAARALHELRAEPPAPPAPPAAAAATPAALTPAAHNHAAGDSEHNNGETEADLLNSDVKSPVSLVHELALKRNLTVVFSVKSERGPPHMRVFVTTCTVGEMESEGEGNGKKVSKRRAAERMLEEMRRRWPAAALRPRADAPAHRKHPPNKKKPRNLIKENGPGSEGEGGGGGGGGDNPISVLAASCHARRSRSPRYCVVEERGAARRRVFTVRVDAPPLAATGQGPNKKTAKRRAAQNLLLAMEMGPAAVEGAETTAANGETTSNVDNIAKINNNNNNEPKRRETETTTSERQPVPGVLLMDYHRTQPQAQSNSNNSAPVAAAAAGEEAEGTGAAEQLAYLSELLGFTVQYSDFPKRNHGEFLSLVSLSTTPPVMCHGAGATTRASHHAAAAHALAAIAKLGLHHAPENEPAAPAPIANTSEC